MSSLQDRFKEPTKKVAWLGQGFRIKLEQTAIVGQDPTCPKFGQSVVGWALANGGFSKLMRYNLGD